MIEIEVINKERFIGQFEKRECLKCQNG